MADFPFSTVYGQIDVIAIDLNTGWICYNIPKKLYEERVEKLLLRSSLIHQVTNDGSSYQVWADMELFESDIIDALRTTDSPPVAATPVIRNPSQPPKSKRQTQTSRKAAAWLGEIESMAAMNTWENYDKNIPWCL